MIKYKSLFFRNFFIQTLIIQKFFYIYMGSHSTFSILKWCYILRLFQYITQFLIHIVAPFNILKNFLKKCLTSVFLQLIKLLTINHKKFLILSIKLLYIAFLLLNIEILNDKIQTSFYRVFFIQTLII